MKPTKEQLEAEAYRVIIEMKNLENRLMALQEAINTYV